MRKRIIFLSFLLSLLLVGCSENKVDSITIDNDFKMFLTDDFLLKHRTRGAAYQTADGDYEFLEEGDSNITVVVKNKEEYELITNNPPHNIDFDNQLVVIYLFTNYYPGRNYYIVSKNLNNNILTLNIKIKRAKIGVADASMPYQRVLLFILDKNNVDDVVIIK